MHVPHPNASELVQNLGRGTRLQSCGREEVRNLAGRSVRTLLAPVMLLNKATVAVWWYMV